jgi:CRP-like cAMP-binding protein
MTLGKTLLKASGKARHLHHCPICSGLGLESLAAIAHIATEKTYEKGQFIMQEGEKGDGFFLVLEGRVRVYKSSPSGREKVLLIAETGMTFAEDTLFGEGNFLEMAVALTKTQALLIPRQEFLILLENNPSLSFQVMEALSIWIKRLSYSLESDTFLSARNKTARFLYSLSNKLQSNIIELPTKKKEIADQLGLAPETFSRALHEFSEQNIIQIERRKIKILDMDQLQELSN